MLGEESTHVVLRVRGHGAAGLGAQEAVTTGPDGEWTEMGMEIQWAGAVDVVSSLSYLIVLQIQHLLSIASSSA